MDISEILKMDAERTRGESLILKINGKIEYYTNEEDEITNDILKEVILYDTEEVIYIRRDYSEYNKRDYYFINKGLIEGLEIQCIKDYNKKPYSDLKECIKEFNKIVEIELSINHKNIIDLIKIK